MGMKVVDGAGVTHEVPLEVEAEGPLALDKWCRKHVPGYPFPVKGEREVGKTEMTIKLGGKE